MGSIISFIDSGGYRVERKQDPYRRLGGFPRTKRGNHRSPLLNRRVDASIVHHWVICAVDVRCRANRSAITGQKDVRTRILR